MEKCYIAFIKIILKNTRELKASQPCLHTLIPVFEKSLFGKRMKVSSVFPYLISSFYDKLGTDGKFFTLVNRVSML